MLTLLAALLVSPAYAVDGDGDGFQLSDDCDDSNPAINPAATEVANGLDDDCDGSVDEGTGGGGSSDNDRDGYTPATGDCDDNNPNIGPMIAEICDNIDQDCDARVDDGLDQDWFADADGDGYGDPAVSTTDCAQPAGHVADDADCDDADADVNPGATEVPGDSIDNDCDGVDDAASGDSAPAGPTAPDEGGCDSGGVVPRAGLLLGALLLTRRRR